jgi:histone H3/H4
VAETPPTRDGDRRQPLPRTEFRASDPLPITADAERLLAEYVGEYASGLTEEAARVAHRRGASDVVSDADVRRAAEKLGAPPRTRRIRFVGTTGSLLLGAAIGNALQIASAPQVTPEGALLTFAAGAFGAAMMVLGFVRD